MSWVMCSGIKSNVVVAYDNLVPIHVLFSNSTHLAGLRQFKGSDGNSLIGYLSNKKLESLILCLGLNSRLFHVLFSLLEFPTKPCVNSDDTR